MYIIPRLTPDTLPDAVTAAAWRADGVALVHLMLDTLTDAEAAIAALADAGFAVQVELGDRVSIEEAAEGLWTGAERLFVPFGVLARPRALSALIERWGMSLGVALSAEEGAVRDPLSAEPDAMLPLDAVRLLETAGAQTILYRDVAAECLPLGQLGALIDRSEVSFFAAGVPDETDDLAALDRMGVVGWLCPPGRVQEAICVLRKGDSR